LVTGRVPGSLNGRTYVLIDGEPFPSVLEGDIVTLGEIAE
jgi:hypothetical protein